jgi:hypothetical protein
MGSELAQLMQQIELECQSIRSALEGYAVVSNHEAINHKYDALGGYQEQLQALVGEQEAGRVVFEAYQKAVG